MNTIDTERALDAIRQHLQDGNVDNAVLLIESLLPPDQADVFEALTREEQIELLPALDVDQAADILEQMTDQDAAQLATQVDAQALASIIDQMESDEAADLLGDLELAQTADTLAHMSGADDIRPLLVHSDESAGGRMVTDFWAFPQTMRVQDVLSTMRLAGQRVLEIPRLYITDNERHLLGEVSIYHLLRATPEATLASLMDTNIVTTHVGDDQEVAARLMLRYGLEAVPVVNDENCLVGVITADDLADILEQEATEDIHRIGGSLPMPQPYLRINIGQHVKRRAGLLILLLLMMALASPVINLFEAQLAEAIVLTFFIPMLMGTGGNAGSQTIATIVRALAVGDVGMGDALHVLWRELRTALILGVLLALVAFPIALIWGSPRVGLAVSVSVLIVVIWGNVLGTILPLIAARLNLDPALVSGPLLTTIIDVTALLIYFSIAALILNL